MNAPILRLTALAHGGGCGCKLSPRVLRELLAGEPTAAPFANLLVGTETGDDAAVWRLDDDTCIVATTDFFMPMVDDPFDFGAIAATNALSDVYAMGGRPIFALAVLGMPINSMPTAMIREILRGGAAMAAEAGIPVAGGHSIDSPEPIYGLAVVGLVSTKALRRNSEARPGDALILTKPIGVGIYSAAIKKGALSDERYREMLGFMTRLNLVGAELARMGEVHAMTDVTGFGLLGHGLEMARGAGVTVHLRLDDVPLLTQAETLSRAGFVTGASHRNWSSYGEAVSLPTGFEDWRRLLLTDPQTSGGLLIACDADAAPAILARIREGDPRAAIVGSVAAGDPIVAVDA
ncbi:MAG: selenide, water dikinase SelD [Roseiarcus sp.]